MFLTDFGNSFGYQLTAMPWKCPACGSQIRHSELEAKPRSDGQYRCHICRLELMLDTGTDRLTVAPMPFDNRTTQPSDK
jgi:transposase-like protein